MNRVLRVTRIQLMNAPAVLGLPFLILGVAFLLNLAIFGAIGDAAPPEGRVTGGLMSIYIVMLVVHLQTMTQVFPFALGFSVTRRTFFTATGLLVTGQSLATGIVLYLLLLLERATGGWGLSLRFFGVAFLVQDDPVRQILAYTVPLLALSLLGVFIGVVFKRWGQAGAYVLTVGSAVLLGGFAALATRQDWWPAVGRFFTDQSTFTLLTGYPLALAVLIAGAGYLTIRHATP